MKLNKAAVTAIILTMTIALAGCVPAPQAQSEPTMVEETTSVDPGKLPDSLPGGVETYQGPDWQTSPQPTATEVSLPTQRESPLPLPLRLIVEEYTLVNPPEVEPLTFIPVQGSQASILARHHNERSRNFPDNSFFDGMHQAMRVNLGADDLVAREDYNEMGNDGWVTITRNGEGVYRVGTGPGSPVTALRGLWVYDDHWVLETAQITQRREGNSVISDAIGHISQDGELLNDRYGFEEVFGFQLMAGWPFYFFKQDSKIGFSYAGQVVMTGYDEIPHYACCSGAALNPVSAKNRVAFFAQRDNVWYYVMPWLQPQ